MMKSIKHILVVMDPMTDQQVALLRAVNIAKKTSATIELFLVAYHRQLVSHWNFDKEQTAASQKEYLATKIRWLETYLIGVVEQDLTVKLDACWHKDVAAAVLKKIESCDTDLVVKSTHQHTSINKVLFNPSDWRLLQHCQVPLLLAKKELARESTDLPYSTIMAAVDPVKNNDKPQGLDRAVLDATIGLVALFEASVHVCHCYQALGLELWQSMSSVGMDQSVADSNFEDYQQGIQKHHQKLFNALIDDYDFNEASTHLIDGSVEYELSKLVDKYQVDLLVMGMGDTINFVGNTVEKILDNVHCDILSVRVES